MGRGLLKDLVDLFRLTLLQFLLQETTAMLILAEAVDLSVDVVKRKIGVLVALCE